MPACLDLAHSTRGHVSPGSPQLLFILKVYLQGMYFL